MVTPLHHSVGSLPLAKNALHSPTSSCMASNKFMVQLLVRCGSRARNIDWVTGPIGNIQLRCTCTHEAPEGRGQRAGIYTARSRQWGVVTVIRNGVHVSHTSLMIRYCTVACQGRICLYTHSIRSKETPGPRLLYMLCSYLGPRSYSLKVINKS